MLPTVSPPYSTVHRHFYDWRDRGIRQRINHALLTDVRETADRDAGSTAGVIDNRSVKSTEYSGTRGYEAGKKISGRKQQIVIDIIGLPVGMIMH
jgi:putative transposase